MVGTVAKTAPPVHVVDAVNGVATTSPLGKLSTKAAEVKATAFGLSRRMVIVVATPGAADAVPVVKPTGFPASRVRAAIALCTTTGNLTRSVSLVGCELVVGAPPVLPVTAPAAIALI